MNTTQCTRTQKQIPLIHFAHPSKWISGLSFYLFARERIERETTKDDARQARNIIH